MLKLIEDNVVARKKVTPKRKKRTAAVKVVIPSGKCPYILEGRDETSILKWINQIKKSLPQGTLFQPSAYKYWSRQFYDTFSEEYVEVQAVIDDIFNSKL